MLSNKSGQEFGNASPGPEDGTLRILYRELNATDSRLRNLEEVPSPYTKVETEMLRRQRDETADRIQALIDRRR